MTNNRPKIRFDGFTSNWEQRKLKELADFSKGNGYTKNDLTDEGKPIILYGRLYTNYETIIESVDTFTNEKENSILSEGNEVIVPSSGETSEEISRASAVGKSGIILGGDLNIVRPNNEIDSTFLALTISNGKEHKELSKRAQGKSVVHLHNADLKEINLSFPEKEEQTKIGNFFKNLDGTIVLHRCEYEKYISFKKAMLQKMLPRDGENVPEIRFQGFTENWEQHKLGDKVEFYSGLTYSPDNIVDSGTLVLRSSNVKNGEIVAADNVYVNPEFVNSQNVEIGDVIVVVRNGSRNLIGKHACVKKKMDNTVIGAFMTGIRSETPAFTNVLLDSNQFAIEINKNLGATINQITTGEFKKMKFSFPSLEEQEKIGAFFEKIDNIIVLHQEQLNKLKQIKKSMLQKMFV